MGEPGLQSNDGLVYRDLIEVKSVADKSQPGKQPRLKNPNRERLRMCNQERDTTHAHRRDERIAARVVADGWIAARESGAQQHAK